MAELLASLESASFEGHPRPIYFWNYPPWMYPDNKG